MKTAERVLLDMFNQPVKLLDTSASMRVSSCIEAMREYAEQVLREAAGRTRVREEHSGQHRNKVLDVINELR
jgi:hypothetical protein